MIPLTSSFNHFNHFPDTTSQVQCEIIKNKEEVFLKDLSSNGTFVNGLKVGEGKQNAISLSFPA